MGQIFRRLLPGVTLIVMASAILLWSDAPRRPKAPPKTGDSTGTPEPARTVKVAMMQMASQPILDDGAVGVIEGLKQAGYVQGSNLQLKRFNAERDIATANAIASEVTGGDYDLIITLTTGALQAVANANKQRHVPHVFGLVTDPIKAGVGVGTQPLDHPDYMVGIGTLQPVAESLKIALRLNPKATRVGVAWNPAEINSEVTTKLAREACKDLKLELLEATVENSAAVNESVASLIARQVDFLWVGGDVTVLGAFDLVAKAARNAGIPVCTCMPGNVSKGSLLDLGANYYAVGVELGQLAAKVLSGEQIANLPVRMAIPPKLMLNKVAIGGLAGWSFPTDVMANADAIFEQDGLHEKAPVQLDATNKPPDQAAAPSKPLDKLWQLRLVAYVNSPDVEETEHGLRDGLKAAGLVERRDYELKAANAQGDITTLHGMVDAALADHADLILTISTQALQSAVHRARGTPIVFSMVANPFAAGVATTDNEHLPGLTGAYGSNDVDAMLAVVKQLMPQAKRIGGLYVPTEVNSVYYHSLLVKAARSAGYELIAQGLSSPSEAPDTTQSLCNQQIDLICLTNSNLAGSSFPTIIQTAKRARIPVFGFLGSMASKGAVVVMTRDYYDMGLDSGQIAARVMRGEKPAAIPLQQCLKTKLLINREAAKAAQIQLPQSLLKKADQVID